MLALAVAVAVVAGLIRMIPVRLGQVHPMQGMVLVDPAGGVDRSRVVMEETVSAERLVVREVPRATVCQVPMVRTLWGPLRREVG
jgi:hypothetical protein